MTIHLSSLDETEHERGPFSAEAKQNLEAIDGLVSQLAAAARANDPTTVVMVVSDHGFVSLTHQLNLFVPFLQAELVHTRMDPETKTVTIDSWKAQPWLASGMAAIMLNRTGNAADDQQTEQQVRELLQKLLTDANNGVVAILDRDQLKQRGGFPGRFEAGLLCWRQLHRQSIGGSAGNKGRPRFLTGVCRDAGFVFRGWTRHWSPGSWHHRYAADCANRGCDPQSADANRKGESTRPEAISWPTDSFLWLRNPALFVRSRNTTSEARVLFQKPPNQVGRLLTIEGPHEENFRTGYIAPSLCHRRMHPSTAGSVLSAANASACIFSGRTAGLP